MPPADKSRYYGESDYLLALDGTEYQSPKMMVELATENTLDVEMWTGTLIQTYPIVIEATVDRTAVEFTLTGGLGYTPVTVQGLVRPDGWRLEREIDGTWESLGQAVHGNDYWQANFDEASGSYDLTYNVHNPQTTRYRLTR